MKKANKETVNEFIPLSVPNIKGNEWKYIKECLDSEWVSTAGKFVDLFEDRICEYTGSKYAVACVNGTSALHISLIIAGVAKDDEVIVPTITFIAPINAVRYCGAYPVFMDADNYFNIDSEKTVDFLLNETETKEINLPDGEKSFFTFNKKTGRKISAFIPVHVFGNAANLYDVIKLCKDKNIKVIEDSSESLGTKYITGKFSGKHTGTIADLGCISFNGNKIITTGGGGMILTNNGEYARKAKYLTTQAKDDEVRYIHNEIGYNYRLTNIQAALGVAQLEKLDEFIQIKKENYYYYQKKIECIKGLHISVPPEYAENNYWMYTLRIDDKVYGRNKEELMTYLGEHKIQSRPVWFLNHIQKEYRECQSYLIENASYLHNSSLSIPSGSNLQKANINRIVEILNER